MKIMIITDAWDPQVNGVVRTLKQTRAELTAMGHEVEMITPNGFKSIPCPTYPDISLSLFPGKKVRQKMEAFAPDAIHIATEGPLGWAARGLCKQRNWPFTTAFHTRFPEVLKAAVGIPLWIGYALFRHFHKPSAGVMVPTQGVLNLLTKQGFRNLKLWTHGVDTELFEYASECASHAQLANLPRPLSVFVGRVSYEKNIETYLQMPFDGSKVVCGVGPLAENLQTKYPQITWLGLLPRPELAKIYASADVFVFPSRNETFGLVMLEAMACGTPVAAFPVDGPLEVLTETSGQVKGGVLNEDLAEATRLALTVPRETARSRAYDFSWSSATQLFISYLKPIGS
jgi:glycosyltransferase involved in cell wall biosynthesis